MLFRYYKFKYFHAISIYVLHVLFLYYFNVCCFVLCGFWWFHGSMLFFLYIISINWVLRSFSGYVHVILILNYIVYRNFRLLFKCMYFIFMIFLLFSVIFRLLFRCYILKIIFICYFRAISFIYYLLVVSRNFSILYVTL